MIDTIDKLIEECPLVINKDFLRRFPENLRIIGIIYSRYSVSMKDKSSFPYFDRLGITSINEYVEGLSLGKEAIVESYNRLLRIIAQ